MNNEKDIAHQNMPCPPHPQNENNDISTVYRKVIDAAPVLHEWDIKVTTSYAWVMITILLVFMIVFGAGFSLLSDGDDWAFLYSVLGVFAVMIPYIRYFIMADKDYHYRLTTEGVIVTSYDAIPDMAYTIVRGLAWLGVVACVMAVAILGPLALAGAGGMALLAIFFTGFKKDVNVQYIKFSKSEVYVIKVVEKKHLIRFETVPFESGAFSDLHCHPDNIKPVMAAVMSELGCSEYREFNSEFSLRRSPLGSFDAGIPKKLEEMRA